MLKLSDEQMEMIIGNIKFVSMEKVLKIFSSHLNCYLFDGQKKLRCCSSYQPMFVIVMNDTEIKKNVLKKQKSLEAI
jgi:hypothetical protein